MIADVVVRGEDVRLLGGEELLDGERERLLEGVGVSLLGGVFALLGGDEELVVAVDDLGLDVAPNAMEGSGGGAGLLHVMHAGMVELVFEFGAEVGALEAFGEEVALELGILEVLSDVSEALLAVLEAVDDVLQYANYFVVIDGFCHGGYLS